MHSARRSLVAAAVTAVSLGSLVLAAAGPAHADPTTDPARAGSGWLARQVAASGLIAGQGGPDRNATALSVLALGSTELGGAAVRRAVDALAANVDAYAKDGDGNDRPAALGTLIQVAVVAKRDPRAFGGADLVARLVATKRTTGSDAGLFGVQDPTFDGAYRQAVSLLGLEAAGASDADALAWLRGQQCPDGGWEAYRADEAAPCTPTNAAAFAGEDTNSTAIAAQALDAFDVTPAASALGFLDGAQNADGGFGFLKGTSTDANSTALATQAILALGEDPRAGRWADADGDHPLAALLRFQLGCSAPAEQRGAFAYQPETDGSLSPNVLATVQVIPALARTPYPIAAATFSDEEPTLSCPRAQASAPPTARPAPVPTASPSPRTVGSAGAPVVAPAADELSATGPGDGLADRVVLAITLMMLGGAALAGATRVSDARG